MLNKIADLIEFDPNRFSSDAIITEFNHKFVESILKIDGAYHKVTGLLVENGKPLLWTISKSNEAENKLKAITTIEKVQPKTGLYSSKHGLLYLYRLPKRQWIKSLALRKNYEAQELALNENSRPTIYNTVLIDNAKYDKESIIHDDVVYLHWRAVGRVVEGDTILVTNPIFLEEIKELWNSQYRIILDANHQPQKVDAKLILDF